MVLQPYADAHRDIKGPNDARPTASQIVHDCDAINKLRGRNILITGCSGGLGAETARALYQTGANLYLTARDMPKLHKVIDDIVQNSTLDSQATSAQLNPIELHLDSLESIRQSSAEILAKTNNKLDMLVLNAGVMAGPLSYTPDGFERQFGTNHLAGFLLFQLLEPTLTNAGSAGIPSRVVVVSSAGHAWSPVCFEDIMYKRFPMTYNQWQAYGSSKTANIYMASAIDRKFQPKTRAWSVHPGGIATDLARNLKGEDFAGFGDVGEIFKTYKSVEQGAATTVWACLSQEVERIGGTYLADCGETLPRQEGDLVNGSGYAEHAYDREAEERLWRMSLELVGLQQ